MLKDKLKELKEKREKRDLVIAERKKAEQILSNLDEEYSTLEDEVCKLEQELGE